MNVENAPWLFAPALVYAIGIVALILLEIVNKTLVSPKWKHRAVFLGITPLIIILLIAILSMTVEMLYHFPDYAALQQGFKQLFDVAYGYNSNLLIMTPVGTFYFILISVSQNKNVLIHHNGNQGNSKTGPNSTDDQTQAKLKRKWEEDEQISRRMASDEAEGIFT